MEVLIPVLGAAAAMAAVGWQGKNEGSRPSRLEPRIGMFFLFYCFFLKKMPISSLLQLDYVFRK